MLSGAGLFEAYGVILFDEANTIIHMAEFGYDGEVYGEVYGENTPHYADWDKLTIVRRRIRARHSPHCQPLAAR